MHERLFAVAAHVDVGAVVGFAHHVFDPLLGEGHVHGPQDFPNLLHPRFFFYGNIERHLKEPAQPERTFQNHESFQSHNDTQARSQAGPVHACPGCHANSRHAPDGCGAGETQHEPPVLNDGPRSQKTDAGDDLGRDARRVRVSIAHAYRGFGHVNRQNHKQGGADADENMSAQARRLAAIAPLQAYQKAAESGNRQPRLDLHEIRLYDGLPHKHLPENLEGALS